MLEAIQIFAILFFSIVLHECSHGWVAFKLGDPTAKMMGRLTLNPIKHIDPVGTIIVPLILKFISSPFVIGWAKPVPINFSNLRHPKRDILWVGLAGPSVNLFLAFLFSLVKRLAVAGVLADICVAGILINLILAIFNLMPIPPLDGSRILFSLLPNKYARPYSQLEPYGLFIVFVFFLLGFFKIVFPLVSLLAGFLGVDMQSLGL